MEDISMKGLLIKDFNLFKKRGMFIIIIALGYMALNLSAGNSVMGVALATIMIGVFSLTTITYDEYENGMAFLFTLPITRKDYVREKYVFGFLVTTVVWLVTSAVCLAYETVARTETSEPLSEKLAFCVTYLLVTYLLLSVQIALKLKFAERSGLVMVMVGAIAGGLIAFLYAEFGVTISSYGIQTAVLAVVAGVAVALLMFVFYQWAVRIMEKREF